MKIHGALPKTPLHLIEARIAELALAFKMVEDEMHRYDGTTPGNDFGMPEMRVAHQHLETAWLWAKQAVEAN
jgi:hypothetical protein